MHRSCLAALLTILFLAAGTVRAPAAELNLRCRWTSPNDRAPLDLSFAGNPLLVMLPGECLEVSVAAGGADAAVTIMKDGKPLCREASLQFTAPDKPGSFYIPLVLHAGAARRDMEICVLVPHRAGVSEAASGWELRADGQDIGRYRRPESSGNRKVRGNPDRYRPPGLWMRLTDMNRAFEVAPGLPAGSLVVPSEDTNLPHTDLVPVSYPMWLAIGVLRDALQTRGIPGSALRVISAFRAPHYNRKIGSGAFGRHIYGDAFDFYIDSEGNGKASDLNRDGRLDRRDAYPVVAVIEDLQADGRIPMGGIGVYNTVGGDHVVTMHLDLRGHRATWGYLYSAGGKKSEFSWASRRFADLDRREEDAAAERAAKEGKRYVRPNREPLP